MLKRIRMALPPLLAGVMTMLLFACGYVVFKLYPFGENSIVWCDMEQQAVPLLLQLKEILRSGESLTYAIYSAGGMNFWGVFFFFLSNPLSFVVLMTDIPVDLLMNLLVPIKLALCAATAAIWLRYRNSSLPTYLQILLAVMYGCSGYGLFYYQNLMWLDVQAMFPLMLTAVDMLVKQKRNLPYLLALSAIMVLNFYTGYMVVVFLVLYTALRIWFAVPQSERGETALRFWLCNVLSALATAVVWLPTFLQVMASARSSNLISSLQKCVIVDALPDKLSLIGCSGLAIASFFMLWAYHDEDKKSQRRRRAIALLMFFAMLLDPINRMWHMGSYQAFPFRWCFIPLLLLLTFSSILLTSDCSGGKRGRFVWLFPILLMCAYGAGAVYICKKHRKDVLSYVTTLWCAETGFLWMFLLTMVAALIYVLIVYGMRRGHFTKRGGAVLLTMMFLGEFTLNFYSYYGNAANVDRQYQSAMSAAHQLGDSDDFFRIRPTRKYTHANMMGALGYPTLSHYTSLTRADYMEGMKKFGYTSYWMEVSASGGTVLSDAIWNVRYLLGQNRDFLADADVVWTDGTLSYAKNEMQLPLGILTNDAPDEIADLPDGTRSQSQNALAERMLGISDLVTDYEITGTENLKLETNADTGEITCKRITPDEVGELSFTFFVSDEQALYFDLFTLVGTQIGNPRKNAVSVFFNGNSVMQRYPDDSLNGMLYLGDVSDTYVTVRVLVEKDFTCESLGVCGFHLDKLRDACENTKGAAVTYDGKGRYTALSDADEPSLLTLAIPYDEGFSATVNGEKTTVYRVNTCMMAVKVPAGKATVSLKFYPRGLLAGVLLSVMGILLICVWLLLRKRIIGKYALTMPRRIAFIGTSVAFVAAIFGIYIFPCVIYFIGIF